MSENKNEPVKFDNTIYLQTCNCRPTRDPLGLLKMKISNFLTMIDFSNPGQFNWSSPPILPSHNRFKRVPILDVYFHLYAKVVNKLYVIASYLNFAETQTRTTFRFHC